MASFSLYLEALKNPESAYNSASVPDRADLIVAQSKFAKGMAVEEDVAKILAKLNYRPLQEFRNAGNQPFDTVADKSPTFDGYRARLEKLSKQSAVVTQQLVDFFEKRGTDYQSVMQSLAKNINDDPKFAEAIIGKIEKNPGQTGALFTRYAEVLDGKHGGLYAFINEQKGIAVPPPTTQNNTAKNNTQTAAQQFDTLMADPKNKAFADYARGKKVTTKVGDQTSEGTLYDAMRAAVDKDHKKLRSLNDPAQMKNYLAMMSDDKVPEDQRAQAIIAQFRGDPPPGLMEQGQAMMEQMKKDHPGLAKFGDWVMESVGDFMHKCMTIGGALCGDGHQAQLIEQYGVKGQLARMTPQMRAQTVTDATARLAKGEQGYDSPFNLMQDRLTVKYDEQLRKEKAERDKLIAEGKLPEVVQVKKDGTVKRFDSWAQNAVAAVTQLNPELQEQIRREQQGGEWEKSGTPAPNGFQTHPIT